MFALPGGFVKITENLEDAASRELEEETGVSDIYLRKLPAYGDVGRDPRGRVITIPFLALIDGEKVRLHATGDAELANWHDAYELPRLGFDHRRIFQDALEELRQELQRTSIASKILPQKFTLTELQNAYEIILGRKLDKRNFRKKLKEINILTAHRETRSDGAHRPAGLYSFKSEQFRIV
jgi:8-oxo-dGTP diphosphatase